MKFGAVLREMRLRAGFSQEVMAEKLFISHSNVSRLENNKIELSVETAIRWGQVTHSTEVIAAMLCGIDIATILQNVSMLIGAFIMWF